VLVSQMVNLFEQHGRVFKQVDHEVDATNEAQQMSAELWAVRVVHVDPTEQCLRFWVVLKNSAHAHDSNIQGGPN